MKGKKIITAILFVSLSLIGEGKVQQEDPKSKKIENSPLVRIDLLEEKEEKLTPPARNIFSPQKSSFGPSRSTEEEMETPPAQKEKERIPGGPSRSVTGIRYIGCVFSGQKIVGLVVFEGETLAVEKGDFLTPEFQVREITSQKIVVQGPDSQKRSYPLEGEEK